MAWHAFHHEVGNNYTGSVLLAWPQKRRAGKGVDALDVSFTKCDGPILKPQALATLPVVVLLAIADTGKFGMP